MGVHESPPRALHSEGFASRKETLPTLVMEPLTRCLQVGERGGEADALMQGDMAVPEVGVAAIVALESLGRANRHRALTTKHLAHLDKNAKLRVADIRAESEEGWQGILLRLLEDDDSDVRLRAARSLAVRAGLVEGLEDIGAKAWIQRMWLCIPLPSLQRQILGELPSIAQEIHQGMHPKPSARSSDYHAFLVSLACPAGVEPWGDGFDLEALLRLQGVERDYMAMSLASKLFLGEVRVPGALIALRDPRSISALEEFSCVAQGSGVSRSSGIGWSRGRKEDATCPVVTGDVARPISLTHRCCWYDSSSSC